MAEDSLEIKLPDSFFTALDEVKQSVEEGFEEVQESSRSSFYADNILNAPADLQKIVPVFDTKYNDTYEKIGKSFMKGGAKAFFDYWKIIKKQEDYVAKKNPPGKQLAPIVNINLPDNEKQDKKLSSLESLLTTLLGAGAIALAAWLGSHGTDIVGQAGETFLKALGKLKIFDKKAWDARGAKLAKAIGKISKPFDWLGDLLMGKGKIGSLFGKGVKKIGSTIGGLGKMLTKAGASSIGRILGKLKFIPFLGTALGFYQAYLRFQKGEYIQGAMEIAAALPVVGLPLTIGLNALQSLWDSNIGGGGVVKMAASGLSGLKAGGKGLLSIFSKLGVKLLKPLGVVLKRIPFLGSIISFGFAAKNFSDGDYLKGALNIVSGIANFFPGIGTAIAIGVDVLNYFLTETETGQNITSSVGEWLGKAWDWIKDFAGWIWEGIKAVGTWIWDKIKFGFNFYIDAWKTVFSGIWDGIKWLWGGISKGFSFAWDKTKEVIGNAWNKLVGGFKWAGSILTKITDWAKEKFVEPVKKVWDGTVGYVKSAWDWITGSDNKVEVPEITKTKTPEIKEIEGDLLKARQIAQTEAFQKFGLAAVNDSMEGYREAMAWTNKRADELLKKPQIDLEKAWDEAFENQNIQIQDHRFDKANQNLKIELDNTNNKLNASNVSYQEALKKQQINVQALNSKQEVYLAKIATGIDTLTKVTEEKPVAFADISPSYVFNNNSSSKSSRSSMDPRLNYAGA